MLALALPECKLISGAGPGTPTPRPSRGPGGDTGTWLHRSRGHASLPSNGPERSGDDPRMLVSRVGLRRFVILFPGRSGGTFLASALQQHRSISLRTEPLTASQHLGGDGQARWIHEYLRGPRLGTRRAVGLTTKLGDILDPDATGRVLRDLETRIVLLERRNDVKHAISIIRARALKDSTGSWNRRTPDPGLGPIAVNPEDFAFRLERSRARKAATAAYAEHLGLPLLRVDYAELLTTPTATFARVFEFVGLAPTEVTGETYKVTSDDLRESVRNFDELRARYVGTPLEAMFDEVLTPGT
jgi:hypothetical protein